MFAQIWKHDRRRVARCSGWKVAISQYTTKPDHPNLPEANQKTAANRSKSITEIFTEALEAAKSKDAAKRAETNNNTIIDTGIGAPHLAGYVPRFGYDGFLKKCTWIPFDVEGPKRRVRSMADEKREYDVRSKAKVCLLMAFAGQNYQGMEYNGRGIATVEKCLFGALLANKWILPEHVRKMATVGFEHGSRTDAGVSAARMNCSIILPKGIDINDINNDLPSDIRVFGMQRAARNFDARRACSARTYSYMLPTIALSRYNDLTKVQDYRITGDRLQLASEILSLYVGERNFHNYTSKKQSYDPLVMRRIMSIDIGRPFIENGIEFCRIYLTGQSFILHQIRKIIATSLAVVRDIIDADYIRRSFTEEKLKTPLAPGLGLMLERLHYTQYASLYPAFDPLEFAELDGAVEEFRRQQIDPIIVEKESQENCMSNWLDILSVHRFVHDPSQDKPEFWYDTAPAIEWGESPEFVAKLEAMRRENSCD